MKSTDAAPTINAGTWNRIPDGTRVRLREGGQEGRIDGLTELVVGSERNPDGKTQYRLNVGDQNRLLVTEKSLQIVLDADGLIQMNKEKIDYRRIVTAQLNARLSPDYFIPSAK